MSGADRLNFRQSAKSRSAIRSGVIIDHLQKHVAGDRDMTQTQVTAGLGLLRKTLPDLKVSDADMTDDGELSVVINKHQLPDAD
jgi:hypothetical protein